MFLKRCERRKAGKKHTYWVLVESYLVGHRGRAILAVLVYTAARVGAVAKLTLRRASSTTGHSIRSDSRRKAASR